MVIDDQRVLKKLKHRPKQQRKLLRTKETEDKLKETQDNATTFNIEESGESETDSPSSNSTGGAFVRLQGKRPCADVGDSVKKKKKHKKDDKQEQVDVTNEEADEQQIGLSNFEEIKEESEDEVKEESEDEEVKDESEDEEAKEESEDEEVKEELEDEEVKEESEDEDSKDQTANLPSSSVSNKFLTDMKFSSLKGEVCENTLKAVAEMGFEKLTQIQAQAIPLLLEGRDLVGTARIGSGKTVAFLIPIIELLYKLEFKPRYGTGCIIISPTREMSMQTFGVLNEVMAHHRFSRGLILEGANRKTELKRLSKGINILVATPGQLLDHLQHTRDFLFENLKYLVIDGADRILDIGFEEELNRIIHLLPKQRQTVLFSATQTDKTQALTKLALKRDALHVGVHDHRSTSALSSLNSAAVVGCIMCRTEKRFLFLYTFLKKNRDKKVMVFFSSTLSVKFHDELLNYIGLPVMCVHAQQKQNEQTTAFSQFCNAVSGILLCTEVTSRRWDIPAVDWMVQYDPPDDPKEYIHRLGRLPQGESRKGVGLLIVTPEELELLQYLEENKLCFSEYKCSWNKLLDIQMQVEKVVRKNYSIHMSARDAYRSYILAYASHPWKDVFNVEKLDLAKVARTFGLEVPPLVEINVHSSKGSRPCQSRGCNDKTSQKEHSLYQQFKKMQNREPLKKRLKAQRC